jgi:hypothetical protein
MALYIDSAFLNDIMNVAQTVPFFDRRGDRAFYARLAKDE